MRNILKVNDIGIVFTAFLKIDPEMTTLASHVFDGTWKHGWLLRVYQVFWGEKSLEETIKTVKEEERHIK